MYVSLGEMDALTLLWSWLFFTFSLLAFSHLVMTKYIPFHLKHTVCWSAHRLLSLESASGPPYWNHWDGGLTGTPVPFWKWSSLSPASNEISFCLMTSHCPLFPPSWRYHYFFLSSFYACGVSPRPQTHWRPGLSASLDHDEIRLLPYWTEFWVLPCHAKKHPIYVFCCCWYTHC